jgi:hypothetical protein
VIRKLIERIHDALERRADRLQQEHDAHWHARRSSHRPPTTQDVIERVEDKLDAASLHEQSGFLSVREFLHAASGVVTLYIVFDIAGLVAVHEDAKPALDEAQSLCNSGWVTLVKRESFRLDELPAA